MKKTAKTEAKIIQGFIRLLENQPLDTITITDIVKEAKVSRTTFYHYFNGLDSLLVDSFQESLSEITRILNQNLLFKQPVLIEMLDYIRENGAYFSAWLTYYPDFDRVVTDYITRMIKESDIENLDKQLEQGYQLPEKFAFDLYIVTIKSIIFNWIKSDFQESSRQIAKMIHTAVQI